MAEPLRHAARRPAPTDRFAAVLLGRTERTVVDLPDRRRGAAFYADPVAWLVVDVAGDALRRAAAAGTAGHTGVVTISREATRHTLRALAAAGPARLSPMRFAGANAGSLAGLACIVHGLTGPSLVLTSAPAAVRDVALVVARGWLRGGACRRVLLAEHRHDHEGHTVCAAVLTRPGAAT